ncbi:hypothetical protein [Mycobacterium sp. NAZ190054]|uniref:DUF6197 family protein n=1 Tax=Mycobacterium sp. NAZ190054 TaxID=1747766 RepID=UPI000794308B|nr:hypothetical protein [Mycobacterium sp. NAZ190054]KWX66842.1 hypothetical protein ASJ79_05610 [Mycobacterium sp. NAZ190054]
MSARDIWIAPDHYLVIEKLSEARQLVRGGWCQGQAHALVAGLDCYCPMGAVSEVCGTVRLSHPTIVGHRYTAGQIVPGAWIRDAVSAALLAAVPRPWITVPGYNDHFRRTQDEAVQLFTAAIDIVARRAAA